MVTSIRDLLDQVDQLAARDATQSSADDAVAALGQLARALAVLGEHRFAAPGVYTAAARRRQLCVRELAAAAGWAAHSGSPASSTQTPPCSRVPWRVAAAPGIGSAGAGAVAADDRLRRRGGGPDRAAAPATDADARWAAAAALAATTRQVAAHARRFAPFARVPELVRVTRLTRLVASSPPSTRRAAPGCWLDRPVTAPSTGQAIARRAPARREVDEAVARAGRRRLASNDGQDAEVSAALAAAAAAETAAEYAAHLADTITEHLRPGARRGVHGRRGRAVAGLPGRVAGRAGRAGPLRRRRPTVKQPSLTHRRPRRRPAARRDRRRGRRDRTGRRPGSRSISARRPPRPDTWPTSCPKPPAPSAARSGSGPSKAS